jgi:hypothetical protein
VPTLSTSNLCSSSAGHEPLPLQLGLPNCAHLGETTRWGSKEEAGL